jgi:hypothetical protein
MPSPAFSINGNPIGAKASVAAGGAVSASLDSTVGVRTASWELIRTDDTSTPAGYTLLVSGPVNENCSTTALGVGTSAALQVTINSGLDEQTGLPSEETKYVVKFYVPTTGGLEVLNAGELEDDNRESSAVFGAVEPLNASIRLSSSGSSSPTYINLVSSIFDTQLTTFTTVSSVPIDGSNFVNGSTVQFECVLETDNVADAAEVRLYNRTAGLPVVAINIALTSPTILTAPLTIGTDIPNSPNIYEVQVRLVTTGAPNTAKLGSALIRNP